MLLFTIPNFFDLAQPPPLIQKLFKFVTEPKVNPLL